MSVTVYGHVVRGTGAIVFENLETCLEQSACIVASGEHEGQVALTLSGATENEGCNDTFYGCLDATTGKFQITIPENCCMEYSSYDCGICFPPGQTPLYYTATFSGIQTCPGCASADVYNTTWYLVHKETNYCIDEACCWGEDGIIPNIFVNLRYSYQFYRFLVRIPYYFWYDEPIDLLECPITEGTFPNEFTYENQCPGGCTYGRGYGGQVEIHPGIV